MNAVPTLPSDPHRTARQHGQLAKVAASLLALVAIPSLLLGVIAMSDATPAEASSHREAPLISADPYADNTDVYAFISPDRNDSVTLVGNWIPFEQPEGGPNYYRFADDVHYDIHVDNVGDAQSHITYRFEFRTETRNPNTFLYNTGTIDALDDADWNVRQFYKLTEIVRAGGTVTNVLATDVPVPPVNIGSKSTPRYESLARQAIKTIPAPGGDLRVFAGPRDDPFFVDLGAIFDLLSLRGQAPPIGYTTKTAGLDGLAGYNVHSIVLQVPISRLTTANESTIGVWASSSRRAMRTLAFGSSTDEGPWVQVSRLGMPLTNEVVLPLALKDAFNSLTPRQDFDLFTSGTPAGNLLATSVLTPELQTLLSGLYGVPKPSGPRTDLLAIFLTGMKTTKPFTLQTPGGPVSVPAGTNVNQPANVRPAEMLRLNTAMAFRPGASGSLCGTPNYALGVLAGDACGFPNGRRLADDVTDISLLAVAGAAYSVLTDDTFAFSPTLIPVLNDSVPRNDKPFDTTFPYLASPHQGQEHKHTSIWRSFVAIVTNWR